MPQVRLYNKKTGITYVYEAENYYDKEKKQGRSKKRLIGKIDPITGNIVPTGKRGRTPKPKADPAVSVHSDAEFEEMEKTYRARIQKLLDELSEKEKLRADLDRRLRATKNAFKDYQKMVHQTISVLYTTPEIDVDSL